ncbi:SPOR domain-containing protein [Palleronia abyssalis]|uniref:SPOR domain-containing protein n=1 Tax=Palleronia abyssalis TaxID=1501240 RepID=A0A2R8BRJ3_9RHOB|nr:SPOR domain-containing protein [Palleronia abyssalis]SPJ22779.1 hypothetical protein PAA8504_00577 [Palleronia abyssalis]
MTDYGYFETDEPELVVGRGRGAQRLVNATGALVSLALVVGMGVWGYKLMVRDVSGVPVIEAMEGAFRTQPEDPGGMTTRHQGLQVNEIAAVGSTAGPVDEVRLAPAEEGLAEEDAPWGELASADTAGAVAEGPELSPEDRAMSDMLSQFDDVAPLTELAGPTGSGPLGLDDAEGGLEEVEVIEDRPEDADPVELAIAEALSSDPVERALDTGVDATRPLPRPRLGSVTQLSARTAAPGPSNQAVDIAALPKGTRLVQLGAYASPDVARDEWQKISGRFTSFFSDKRMVVQEAVSGGKTFFRLRAEGFDDLADARRFCSALTAAQADCIPVELR